MTIYDAKVGDLIQLSRTVYHSSRVGGQTGIVVDKQNIPAKNVVGRAGYVDVVYVMFEGGKIERIPLADTYIFKVMD